MPRSVSRNEADGRPQRRTVAATALAAAAGPSPLPRRSKGLSKIVLAFGTLALLSGALALGGRLLGHSVALAGYTDDTALHEVVIGNNVIAAPANMIRHGRARRDGVASRLDLYLRWPEMDGFSEPARADFNNADGARRILFLAFEPKMMSRDMSGRLEPIYRPLVEYPGRPGPGGTTLHAFTAKSGYSNEVLVVGRRDGEEPFVARCLSGPGASTSLAPCERDIQLGDELSLTYRFPEELLKDWPVLEAAVRREAALLLKTGS